MTSKEEICSFKNLYKAMHKCKRNVMWKDSVQGYYKNGLVNIHNLRKSLLDGTYNIDDYISFKVYEPKERDILATRFKDRAFQRSLCDISVYNDLTRSFVYDNCACQIGKGTEFARKRLNVHLKRFYRKHKLNGYILKLDIKNYFGSTPHSVAKNAVRKRVKDEWVRNKIFDVIDSYSGETGLGLGSQLTQLIQLAVLDDIDHFIKEKMKIKGYIRYMDDMILIHYNEKHLKRCMNEVSDKLNKLGLRLNKKKSQIFPIKQGVKFLGFKFRLTESGKVIITLLKKKEYKEKRNLKKLVSRSLKGKMTRMQVDICFNSFLAHIQGGKNCVKRNTKRLVDKMTVYYNRLWGDAYGLDRSTG